MEIIEVGFKEYKNIFPNPYQFYGSANFAKLNEAKISKVHYLLFKEDKYRLGLTIGHHNSILCSPFSAPFGGFIYYNNPIRQVYIDNSIQELLAWASSKSINEIYITLPPYFYNEGFINKLTNSFFRVKFFIDKIDLNYSFNLINFNDKYKCNIWRNARKNISIALSSSLTFHKCQNYNEKMIAYQIICANRAKRGFPLNMTWENVEQTINIVNADFFLVTNKDDIFIASAIIFYISESIVQIIYWGDIPEYSTVKPMNFLSFKIFEYYKYHSIKIIDIGPSTQNSIPNYGLCEFKESIGCDISSKLTFKYIF